MSAHHCMVGPCVTPGDCSCECEPCFNARSAVEPEAPRQLESEGRVLRAEAAARALRAENEDLRQQVATLTAARDEAQRGLEEWNRLWHRDVRLTIAAEDALKKLREAVAAVRNEAIAMRREYALGKRLVAVGNSRFSAASMVDGPADALDVMIGKLYDVLEGKVFPWIDALYALHADGKDDEAIDLLFERFDEMFSKGLFDQADAALRALDVHRLDATLMVGALSITLPARDRLKERGRFAGRVVARLEQLAPGSSDELLDGLEWREYRE